MRQRWDDPNPPKSEWQRIAEEDPIAHHERKLREVREDEDRVPGGILLGADTKTGRPITISPDVLKTHMHVLGATGVGKSFFLEGIIKTPEISGRDYGIAVHGNRLIAALTLEKLHADRFIDPNFKFDDLIDEPKVTALTLDQFQKLKENVEQHYVNAIIPTLFKNLTKCKHLVEIARTESPKNS